MKRTKAMILADVALGTIRANAQGVEVLPQAEINSTKQKINLAHNEKMKFELQNGRMKTLLSLFLLLTFTLTASAQKSVVLEAFSKHNIDAGILNADNIKQPDNYAFDLKQTTIAAGKQTVIMAKYDPSSSAEEQWTVVSVDGKSPSKKDISSFRKNHKKESASAQPDESSYKIEKETADHLVISYKQDPKSIPKDATFMKDCRSYLTINLKTKKLEQAQALNEKPIKIKILNAEKFDLVIKYSWNDQEKRYFTVSQNLDILAKFLGQATNVQTISEYASFTKK